MFTQKLAIAMITYNRPDLLTQTVESLKQGGHDYGLVLIDNGSTDPAARSVAAGYGAEYNNGPDKTIGFAKNAAVALAIGLHQPDIVLVSDDDYVYRPGALATLMQFMDGGRGYGLPQDVILVGTTMEPMYPWNGITETLDNHGVRALVRWTVPGGGWAFRAKDWATIGGFPRQTWDEDTTVLRRLTAQGYRFCALPLAEHVGTVSLAGNRPPRNAPPVDLQAWGLV